MKKYVVLLILVAVSSVGFAQEVSVNQLVELFASAESCEKVKLGKAEVGLAGIPGVSGMEVYDLEDSPTGVKEKLAEAALNLKDSAYETMVSQNEGGERVKILTKTKKKTIRELVVLVTGGSNVLIRITGKIDPSYIGQMVGQYGS